MLCLSCSWLQHQLVLPLQWGPAQEVVLKKVTCQGLAKWEGGSFVLPLWDQVKERKQKTCEGEKDAMCICVLVFTAVDTLRLHEDFCFFRLNWSTLLPLWLQPRRLGLRTKGPNFMLEDSTFQIFGGSVHYFRVPKEYWRDRLLKMKACGLNTLTT